MHLNSFEYFRGLAIILIVAGHSYGPWAIESFYEKVVANLITGGTAFFVFISGFFFHHVFYPKFQYRQFLLKKAKYVLLPYAVLTLAGVICFAFYLDSPPFGDIFITPEISGWPKYIRLCLGYLWTGRILDGYWYIPFIMIIFALSPLFIKQIQQPVQVQLGLFILLLGVAALVQRPADNLSPIHSVIYFFPVYMLGIICSMQKAYIFKYLEGKSAVLGLFVVLLSAAQVLIYGRFGNFHKETMFSFGGIDLIIFQKILMCFFLLSVMQKWEHKNIPFLKYLASASFAIYFLHPWVLYFLNHSAIFNRIHFLPGILGFVLTVPLVIAISLAIATMFKWIFASKSRFVIGW